MVEVLAGIFVIYLGLRAVVGLLGYITNTSLFDRICGSISVWEVPKQKPKSDVEPAFVTRARNKTREEWEG